ncbi:LLM class flavin-dependent oxidoreductase [Streptomyces sirii]|uniref:LLM class flavin-dependent oxidoreductase n=1 Tax=Streptomyces sirii TaxID=3127701 RepID=UPI003D35D9F2
MITGNGPCGLRCSGRSWPAPFPALVAAAEATERPRMGTFVLNAGFFNPALLAREVATTDALTGGRLEPAELNILVQRVLVTDDRRAAAREIAALDVGLDEEQALDVPTLLIGTPRQMAEQLRERRERFGFSYITVLDPFLEAFAPVLEELAGS